MFLNALLGLIFGCFLIGIPIALIWSIIDWAVTLKSTRPWLKFKEFIKLYNIDSNKWNIGGATPKCAKVDNAYWSSDYIYFKLNYIDHYRYKLWKFNHQRQKRKEYARYEYMKALEAFNKTFDIEVDKKRVSMLDEAREYLAKYKEK